MNITANTVLQLPADGVFNCTTVSISSGATLTFLANSLNTPVYILATGDVNIAGTIDISGKGPLADGPGGGFAGPGGFPGGNGGVAFNRCGPGGGPGGGLPQLQAASNPTVEWGHCLNVYGNNLIIPLIGGSGAGGMVPTSGLTNPAGVGGGGGGGAILISSNTRISFNSGKVLASAGGFVGPQSSGRTTGSGGAVRLVSPIVTGSTYVNIKDYFQAHADCYGRFRIDTWNANGFVATNDAPTATGSIMTIFPTPMPRLSVVNAAGTSIAENAAAGVVINLPSTAPTSQPVKVRARDFGGIVPIRVRIVPEAGQAGIFDGVIDNTVNNPAETTVTVTIPTNTGVKIEVFTR